MQVRNATGYQMREALKADPTGNLTFNRFDGGNGSYNVTLRVNDSKGRFHRRSHMGRRMPSACYHGHYAWMARLFALAPDARITSNTTSGRTVYDGHDSFHSQATIDDGMIAGMNVGSMMQPMIYSEACDCGDDWNSICDSLELAAKS